jgi:hypothetical protein
MELETQIRALLQEAPLQYGNRTQALLGLFGTPENGFTWQGGELARVPGRGPAMDPPDLLAHLDPQATYDLDASIQSLHAYGQFTQAVNRARRARFVRGNLDYLARQAPVPKRVPPDFNVGRIREIPDNVRDDWLQGALEFLLLVLRMDAAFVTRGQKNSDQIRAGAALLQALLLRFAQRVAFVPLPGAEAMASARDEMPEATDA